MVKLAALGKSFKADLNNFLCIDSAKAQGLIKPDVNEISGNVYYSFGLYDSLCTARNIKMAGNSGICSECTATPYDTNDMNLSLLCSNTRFSAKWRDDEIGIGMPFGMFEKVYDGVMKTIEPCEPKERKMKIIQGAKRQVEK